MTEAEWLMSTDPSEMLWSLRSGSSERKQRLFAVACCHRVWDSLVEDLCRNAVEVAERLADGNATLEEWHDVMLPAAKTGWDEEGNNILAAPAAAACRSGLGYDADIPAAIITTFSPHRDEAGLQAALVRCIFGNPFRPVAFNPAWRTSDVVALARGIYDDRAFDRMPILADALQDAGCDNDDILNHCRAGTPHARGCWVVDLVLGKA